MGTFDSIQDRTFGVLGTLDRVIIAIFVIELFLRGYAARLGFFKDPWNVFDLLVVLISLVPAVGWLSVLRAMRIVRVLRLVSKVPGMRKVVDGLLRAIPAMLSIVFLLCLVVYVGAVLATELYKEAAPDHFGHLGRSLYSLFQVMTGEGWPDMADEVRSQHPSAWIFFVTYILISTFVVLNLFTGVIVSFMAPPARREKVQLDEAALDEIRSLRREVAQLRAALSSPAAGPVPAPAPRVPQ